MKSSKCYQCGFVGWADAEFCKKCGAQVRPGESYQPPPRQWNQTAGNGDWSTPQPKTGLAVASLIVGIISCLTISFFGLAATVGIILSIIALLKASHYPQEYGGRGMATAGLVTSILSVAILVPVVLVAAIAIPNLLASARAANEGSAIAALRTIANAEATYQSMHGNYGDLDQLAAEHLIDSAITLGPRHGYRFAASEHRNPVGYEATAVPVSPGTSGIRSFFIDETGVIRGAAHKGSEATKVDPPLDYRSDRPGSRPRSYDSDDRAFR
jgi:type II secretory pathway pseudopilin PulG